MSVDDRPGSSSGARSDGAKEAPTAEQIVQQQLPLQRREARIGSGVAELERWLQDLVRAGLAEATSRPWSSFELPKAVVIGLHASRHQRVVVF